MCIAVCFGGVVGCCLVFIGGPEVCWVFGYQWVHVCGSTNKNAALVLSVWRSTLPRAMHHLCSFPLPSPLPCWGGVWKIMGIFRYPHWDLKTMFKNKTKRTRKTKTMKNNQKPQKKKKLIKNNKTKNNMFGLWALDIGLIVQQY